MKARPQYEQAFSLEVDCLGMHLETWEWLSYDQLLHTLNELTQKGFIPPDMPSVVYYPQNLNYKIISLLQGE